MPTYTPIRLTLDQIAGRSHLNARPERLDDDVDGLAATIEAVGLLQKITVIRVSDAPSFEVIAGWRRTKALRIIAAAGRLVEPFEAIEFEGADEDAISASIAENTERRALHPAEEAEAFAMLATHGQAPEDIARHFGVSVRHVKGRLRLADVCAEAMAQWKDGKLTLDAVQALSAGTHDQQRALLQDRSYSAGEAWYIRSRLNSGKVAADDIRARYVGRDAYVAAGGALDENLFGEFDFFNDEALLDRLVREKLLREGEALCAAEGWGFCVLESDWDERSSFYMDNRSDMLDTEQDRIAEIRDEIERLEGEDEPDADGIAKLEAEFDAIEARAKVRAIPSAERAVMGISVEVGVDARIDAYRGWIKRADAPRSTSSAATSVGASSQPEPVEEPAPKPSKALDNFLANTRSQALREAVRIRPDLALIFATASLALPYGNRVVHLRGTIGRRPENQLARAAADCAGFGEAVMLLAKAPQGDVLVAFADLVAASVAASVAVGDAEPDEIAAAFASAVKRGSAVEEHLHSAFDPAQYFAAASKDICVEALVEIDGSNTCISKKKSDIADHAANRARETRWLPRSLKGHCPIGAPAGATIVTHAEPAIEEPTLAQAMSSALEAAALSDEDWQASISEFVANNCRSDETLRVKASVLYEAWKETRRAAGLEVCSIQTFGRLVRALGHTSHRFADGVRYLGIDLVAEVVQAAE